MNNLNIIIGMFFICIGISCIVEGVISKIYILKPNEQHITIDKQYPEGDGGSGGWGTPTYTNARYHGGGHGSGGNDEGVVEVEK